MPHMLLSMSVQTGHESGVLTTVELSGPDSNETFAAVQATLEMTGVNLDAQHLQGGISFTWVVTLEKGQIGGKSDLRMDRMIILLSDTLEQTGWSLRTCTTDRQTESFTTYMLIFHQPSDEIRGAPAAAAAAMFAMMGRDQNSQ
jgi:hypothetical protein